MSLRPVLMLTAALAAALPAAVLAQPVPTAVLAAAPDHAGFSFSGSLQAERQSTVAAQVGGNVQTLAVQAGDRVRAGQVLARIDARDTQAGLASADAGVAQADAQWQQAQLQVQRTRELHRQGFVSQAALDVAETQWRATQAALDQARAGRTQAALARSFAAIAAPFDAVVLATHVEAGDLATPGRPLLTLYAPGALRAVVMVPASRAAVARAATAVEVQLPDGRWVTPASRSLLPVADPVSQTVEWRLPLTPVDAAGWTPGQAVNVRFAGPAAGQVVGQSVSRPVVPASAVLQRGELSAVYAVRGDRFVLQAVRLGARQALADGADGVQVLAGLKPGDRFALDAVRAGLAGAVPAP